MACSASLARNPNGLYVVIPMSGMEVGTRIPKEGVYGPFGLPTSESPAGLHSGIFKQLQHELLEPLVWTPRIRKSLNKDPNSPLYHFSVTFSVKNISIHTHKTMYAYIYIHMHVHIPEYTDIHMHTCVQAYITCIYVYL